MSTAFSNLLAKKVDEHRREVLESIGAGACPDFPAYRDQCGYLRGLDAALAICQDIEKRED